MNRIKTLSLLFTCQGFQILGVGAVGLFLPLIRDELHISYTHAGILSAASTLVYAAMQIPVGYLADRFGPRRVYVLGLTGSGLATMLVGVAPHYGVLFGIMLASGFMRSMVFTPGLVLVSGWFGPRRRATAMGGFSAGTLSFNAVLALAGPVLASLYGWRPVFLILGGGGIGAALLFAFLGSVSPYAKNEEPGNWSNVLRLMRYRLMWIIAGIQYTRLAIAMGLYFWMPTFLVDEAGLSLPAAGLIIAMSSLITGPSNLIGGYVSDRIARPVLVICGSLLVITLTLCLLALVENLVLIIAVIAVNAIFVQLYFGPLFALPVQVFGPRMAGTAIGFGNLFANLGGLTFGFALGALKDATGSFTWGFGLLAVLAAGGLLLGTLLPSGLRANDGSPGS